MDNDSEDVWFVVSRCFIDGRFSINVIPFKDEDEAWRLVEEEFDYSNSQHWLLTPKEYKTLKGLLSGPIYEIASDHHIL
jgi:hypothetical protein